MVFKITVSEKSKNKKTEDMLTTKQERKTCPPSCPFFENGCYGETGPLSWHWAKMEINCRISLAFF
jgi:hypothetical protein